MNEHIELIDNTYSWKTITLYEFLYSGNIPDNWKEFFYEDNVQSEIRSISEYLSNESKKNIIYPPIYQVFRAFYLTPLHKIKAVILGQDCYHSGNNEYDGSAVGICFSVRAGNTVNPSLRNIYNELDREGLLRTKRDGNLIHWTKDIMMLNASLTVTKGCAGSHSKIWSLFTEYLVKYISKYSDNVVWILFGNHACSYIPLIDKTKNKVIATSHPSPYSYKKTTLISPAFYGSNVFQNINEYLCSIDKKPIEW